eukprot:Plantae.Rhodophyta-Palmaria_palmata.ctg16677.p1 GENE.Plantae.Rhodophyta-Palmaria_palmata.ctg16677~~Plantae.Rhodophyta-Palmaria_palmata.ctg16677.p1  ORF type:complete len:443 (-),score=54.54 Plantae.Rhodophyta-Palmaria_palmata.ctg16677:64-1344(-)
MSADSLNALVQGVYQSVLNREGEEAGVRYWIGEARKWEKNGMSQMQISQRLISSFRRSSEYMINQKKNKSKTESTAPYGTARAVVNKPLLSAGKCKGSCPTRLVQSVYGSILKRVGEPAGVKYWVGEVLRLRKQGMTEDQIRQSLEGRFITSQEYVKKFGKNKNNKTSPRHACSAKKLGLVGPGKTSTRRLSTNSLVQEAYKTHLQRTGEPAGVKYWIEQVDARCNINHSDREIRPFLKKRFIASAEYKKNNSQNKAESDKKMVQAVYRSILRREGEDAGVKHWLKYVATRRAMGHCDGSIKKWLEEQFVGSVEYKQKIRSSKGTNTPTATATATAVVAVSPAVTVPVAPVHKGVICDACHPRGFRGSKPIAGVRYKCSCCANYDLCEKCFKATATDASIHNQEHVFLAFSKPVRNVRNVITAKPY